MNVAICHYMIVHLKSAEAGVKVRRSSEDLISAISPSSCIFLTLKSISSRSARTRIDIEESDSRRPVQPSHSV
jgi:hypothetical protein